MGLVVTIDLVVIGVIAAIAFTKGLERALPFAAFVITLVPLESVIPLPGLFDLSTHRLTVMTLALLYCVLGNESHTPVPTATPLRYLILVSLGWNLLSALNSVVSTISLKTVLSQALDFYLLYYIVAKTVSRVDTVNKILTGVVTGMLLCCIFGLLEGYAAWPVMGLFPQRLARFNHGILMVDEIRGLRIRSTYPIYSLYGAALAMTIPLALYLTTIARGLIRKAYLWSAIMLMFWNIYKTATRGAWLACPLALVAMLFHRRTRKYLLVVGLLTISVMIIRPGVYDTIAGQYIGTYDPDSLERETYDYRWALLRVAQQAVSKDFSRILLGYGPESFYYLGLEGEFHGRMEKFDSADNAWANLLTETGYVGMLLVAVLLRKPMLVLLRTFRRAQEPDNLLCLSLFASIFAFLFMMTNLMVWGWGQQSYVLWVLIALSLTYPNWKPRARQTERYRSFTPLSRGGSRGRIVPEVNIAV